MWEEQLKIIIDRIKNGELSQDAALKSIKNALSGHLGFAEIDLARAVRTGFPEVVFCLNKTDEEVLKITEMLYKHNKHVLLTRVRESAAKLLKKSFPDLVYHEKSRAVTIGEPDAETGLVSVVTAGTSDIPIGEEAAVTARMMGARIRTYWDIGIAGIHRLFSKIEPLKESHVIVAVAGMDGALPGVIAGLVECPVIAVPTSIGYGTGAGGYAALMTMLNSCAPGVSVVNIDNGFGAGYTAALINKRGSAH
ncbi:MAG: nickel pincer cofactor biosynthesis protein LarB [Spirochaetales bacterium]|nr:nickel pincer cofactor biosynthesis protein LarB [Spirochaetales bacterium]